MRPMDRVDQLRLRYPRQAWIGIAPLLFASLLASCASPLATTPTPSPAPIATTPVTPTVTPTPPPGATPAYATWKPLQVQVTAVGPLYSTGGPNVTPAALTAAGATLDAMLRHRPDVAATLRAHGVFTIVLNHDQHVCDSPYFASFPASFCARSLWSNGGVPALPVTVCSERNLLAEPDDTYGRGSKPWGQNICAHELAHTIMNIGLTQTERDRIVARFHAVQATTLYTGDYAMANEFEFWAVMSQCYFSAAPMAGPNGDFQQVIDHHVNGPDGLKRYDPETFALLDAIYGGPADLR
jgi:hypothetical protein